MVTIRTIREQDDSRLAWIIRAALSEFGADKPGTVYYDPTTDHLSELFLVARSRYFVACDQEKILGGAGVFPSEGLPHDTGELVKMYLVPEARGKRIGYELLNRCVEFARGKEYRRLYLETLPELSRALALYTKFGFTRLSEPLGNTGHSGCNLWMILSI